MMEIQKVRSLEDEKVSFKNLGIGKEKLVKRKK